MFQTFSQLHTRKRKGWKRVKLRELEKNDEEQEQEENTKM